MVAASWHPFLETIASPNQIFRSYSSAPIFRSSNKSSRVAPTMNLSSASVRLSASTRGASPVTVIMIRYFFFIYVRVEGIERL